MDLMTLTQGSLALRVNPGLDDRTPLGFPVWRVNRIS